MTQFIRFWSAAMAFAICLAQPALADPISITGEVTYRERIALPPGTSLRVQLLDVSLADAPARLHAEAQITGPGQVPLQFSLNFDDKLINPAHQYALVAEIFAEDVLLFRNTTRYSINPLLPEIPVVIVVDYIGQAPTPDKPEPPATDIPVLPLMPIPSAELYGPTWHLRDLVGTPLAAKVDTNLSFTDDGRVGGRGGCNNFFAQAVFDGYAIGFGDVASTMMMCENPAMAQEMAFFAALEEVRTFEVDGINLYFRDADANLLMRLSQ